MSYILPIAALGYDAGTELHDVTLADARSWACNRCGDCCDGSREHVRKDEATGLPLFVWEAPDRAADPDRAQTADPLRYAPRLDGLPGLQAGPLLQPIVMLDGGIGVGVEFDRDNEGRPHTSFRCRALLDTPPSAHENEAPPGPEAGCAIYEPPATAGASVHGVRPLNCGAFPVFGTIVDDAIIGTGSYVPPTGALPRCTWHGIRVTGPWHDTEPWRARFERQQAGEPVPPLAAIPADVAPALLARVARRIQARAVPTAERAPD